MVCENLFFFYIFFLCVCVYVNACDLQGIEKGSNAGT